MLDKKKTTIILTDLEAQWQKCYVKMMQMFLSKELALRTTLVKLEHRNIYSKSFI